MAASQGITICLWFDGQAENAADFYTKVFRDSKMEDTLRYSEAGQEVHKRPPGSVMTIEFELNGQSFVALNGGPEFKFNEAISLQVDCDSQEEVDYYWNALSEGGDPKAQQCGWLKDKFGVSWQVAPRILTRMMKDRDQAKADRVMEAMLPMKKIDIAALERAYAGS
jgi:predicted 3-demethylubiquinone-9 3-methyltransferase (glyoxalase superfamily)